MNGLKIYLRSKVSKAYQFGQLAVAVCLLLNGIFQLEWIHAPVGKMFLSFLAAVSLITSLILSRKVKKHMRFLPGVLSAVGGAILVWNTWDEVETSELLWPMLFYSLGMAFVVLGLSQIFVDVEQSIYLSPRSIRLKRGILSSTRYTWDQIRDVHVDERYIQMILKNGKSFRLEPERCDIQHLRSRVDLMYRSSNAAANANTEGVDLMTDMFGA